MASTSTPKTTTTQTEKSEEDAAKAMPPPPPPAPLILEPEIDTLAICVRNTMVATARIYGFYAKAYKLQIAKHVSLPNNLSSALGKEVEKYDHLCDAIESYLLRDIAVLQRDIRREQERLREEEAKANTQAAADSRPPTDTGLESGSKAPQPITHSPPAQATVPLARRPSAISISSLHRPTVPLKLDLSASSLRLTADEAALFSSSLASPVTLAPKSARPLGPNELPPDFMAAFASASSAADAPHVDVDLTGPDPSQNGMVIDPGAGSSAEKPIELDLDGIELDMDSMTELFGPTGDGSGDAVGVEGLFSPVNETGPSLASGEVSHKLKADTHFLNALGTGTSGHDLFNNLSQDAATQGLKPPTNDLHSVPSPGTLLGFSSADSNPGPSNQSATMDQSFDMNPIDLGLDGDFFEGQEDSDMSFGLEALLGMSGTANSKGAIEEAK
ncbi:hypothetical protein BDN72DRAFT_829831 [Pluteus cervinus]|uniref:Uncharacterized protein n=1 Tax=Pluteus cervinus TaxID=181527 RepID=A0ACD3BFM8_9AGAR|nr:hypothetical protein BDN72DRAFT_829831 [Pluteus cervinus]